METPSHLKPRLSVVVPAMRGYHSVLAALDAWESQTRRGQIELIVVCPEAPVQVMEKVDQIVIPVASADLLEARATGIQRATGEFVTLAEDHCLPDADFAEAILERMEEGWDAVGPALREGHAAGYWPIGAFLLCYGQWMEPVACGPARVLSGWNTTVRADRLRELGPSLADELLLGAFLLRGLEQRGGRLFLENRARMRHFDPPGWVRELGVLATVGSGFGALRTRSWLLVARALYPLAMPAVMLLHFRRALRNYRRAGVAAGVPAASLMASFALAAAWAVGEAAGAWLGVPVVTPYLKRGEVKPVSREEVERSDALQQRAGSGASATAASRS